MANSTCQYGNTGDYYDECGLVFKSPNVKIVGGIEAIPGSWPSIAFIYFQYTFNYKLNGLTYKTTRASFCGATLIDRQTVLTAAHCYVDQVSYTDNYGRQYIVDVVPNAYHKTIESAYTVYLGLHNNSAILEGTFVSGSQGVAIKVKKFIQVSLNIKKIRSGP